MEVSLAEAAFGVTRELKVDTAVVCTTCDGEGTAPGTHPVPCETCRGHRRGGPRAAVVPRRDPHPPAVLGLPGLRHLIPDPCRECSGDGRVRARRSITVKIPAGVDTGTRVQLAGQGEVGAGGGPPATCTSRCTSAPHAIFTREGTTCTAR